VIEAKLDRGRGPVATVLVQRGTLKVGDIVVAGAEWGRVRALINDKGENHRRSRPFGAGRGARLQRPAGSRRPFAVVENEARAREITEYRAAEARERRRQHFRHARLARADDVAAQDLGPQGIPAVIKADVQGSLEAILGSLDKLGTDEVGARASCMPASAASPNPT
jgi:translation initiation factor IF-2